MPEDMPIVDHGHGPRLFASKVLSIFSEGGGAYTFTLAVTEPRRGSLSAEPTSVNAVVGTLTLSANGMNELVNAIKSMSSAAVALKAEKPATGAN